MMFYGVNLLTTSKNKGMKYLILLVGIYLIYRFRSQQRQVNAGEKQAPIDNQGQQDKVKDDEADYIDYEEVE